MSMGWNDVGNERQRALWIGALLAAVTWMLPFPRFVLGYLGTLVHEFGHTLAAWLFGYPAIPAFNFQHGGGVTSIDDRQWPLVLLWFIALSWLLWRYRFYRPAWPLLAIPAALYTALSLTRMHEIVITFMGHGMELIIAGIFFYRALSGSAVRVAAERPLYAFLGIFLAFGEARFAHGLSTNAEKRIEYGLELSGIPNDWLRIADRLDTELAPLMGLYLLLTPLPLLIAYFVDRHRETFFPSLAWRLGFSAPDLSSERPQAAPAPPLSR